MKLMGEEIWGLAKEVVARLAACQRRMGKKKWSDGIDIHRLSGEQWLRLMTGETNMAALAGWCGICRGGESHREVCQRCGTKLTHFNDLFWSQISSKIRRALRNNRVLLSRIKSERESLYGTMHQPTFPAPLEWLRILWEKTSAPPHQPFVPRVHYQVANWIDSLRRLGLSKGALIEVLGDADLPAGLDTGKKQDYAKLPLKDLLTIRTEFRRTVGSLPGSVNDLSEMGRTIQWVARQRTVPMARLNGERVRKRHDAED